MRKELLTFSTIFNTEVSVSGAVSSAFLESHGRIIVESPRGQSTCVRGLGVATLVGIGTDSWLDSQRRNSRSAGGASRADSRIHN